MGLDFLGFGFFWGFGLWVFLGFGLWVFFGFWVVGCGFWGDERATWEVRISPPARGGTLRFGASMFPPQGEFDNSILFRVGLLGLGLRV